MKRYFFPIKIHFSYTNLFGNIDESALILRGKIMKIANYQNQSIYLPEFPRSRYEEIYQASIRGEVKCVNCHQNLNFTLTIYDIPHFYHINKDQNLACMNHNVELEQEMVARFENNPSTTENTDRIIKLPTKRSISNTATMEKTDENQFINRLPFYNIPPYKINEQKTDQFVINQISLDSQQWNAVTHIGSPLLVLAGAGSGKTRVITTRAMHLMNNGILPHEMMLVTFTSKASAEMKERMKGLGYPIQQMEIGTFHSIFYKMLLRFDRSKWDSSRLIKSDFQKEIMLKQIGRRLEIDEKSFAYDQAIQQIGLWKNSCVYPHEIRSKDAWEEQVASLYEGYESLKKQNGQFDFDDMLLGCFEMLNENNELLLHYQNRFKCLLVDEFQDINKIQFNILKILFQHTENITAVGDDDQSIYAFRGSDPRFILDFKEHFQGATIYHLSENYRSTHGIVSLANEVIKPNKNRFVKSMHAQYDYNQVPSFFFPYDEEEEATMIINDIKEKINNGANPGQFAILYRTNTASRAVFERLIGTSLPFTIDQDGDSFYDRPIIRKMISFLLLIGDEDHQAALKEILPVFFLKQQAFQDAKMNSVLQNLSFLEAFTTIKSAAPFQIKKIENLIKILRYLKQASPLEAIERIEESPAFMDYIKKRGNESNKIERPSDDLRDLKVVSKNFKSIREFVDHAFHISAKFKEYKQKKNQSSQGNISLLTAHRSKGLEYDYVYILGVVDGGFPHDYALESLKNGNLDQLEEERRLLYVACTRARKLLYLSILQKRRGKKANSSRLIRRFINKK